MPSPQHTVIYVGEIEVTTERSHLYTSPVEVEKETKAFVHLKDWSITAEGKRISADYLQPNRFRSIDSNHLSFIITAVARTEQEVKEKLLNKAAEITKRFELVVKQSNVFLASQSPT